MSGSILHGSTTTADVPASLTEVGPNVWEWLLQANGFDHQRATIAAMAIEIASLRERLKVVVPVTQHERRIAELEEVIARYQKRDLRRARV